MKAKKKLIKKAVKFITKPVKGSSMKMTKPVPVMTKTIYGDKEWRLHGVLHREDGPAREHANGFKYWYRNGQYHRKDGPAVDTSSDKNYGAREWWLLGKRHRIGGPAIEFINGNQEWWVKGKLHREDGPAIIKSGGIVRWYLNGRLHREDGPAATDAWGNRWALHGREFHSKDDWMLAKEALVEGI